MPDDILVRLRKWLPIVRDDAWAKSLQSDITDGINEIVRLRSELKVLKSSSGFAEKV